MNRESLPEVWRVVSVKKGKIYAETAFSTRAAAEQYVGQEQTDMFGKPTGYQVMKDSPDLHVRIDGLHIHEPIDVSMRETWILRNEARLEPLRSKARPAMVLTWKRARVDDPFSFRYGGRAPLGPKEPWPACANCKEPLSFIGTLDFRNHEFRSNVPGDALVYFQCEQCLLDGRVFWIRTQDRLELKQSPKDIPAAPEHAGVPWDVTDFPWDPDILAPRTPDEEFQIGRGAWWSANVYGCKIGGCLSWLQKEGKIPRCGCKKPMSFLGQFVGENEYLGFGDSGIAYLFACEGNRCPTRSIIQTC